MEVEDVRLPGEEANNGGRKGIAPQLRAAACRIGQIKDRILPCAKFDPLVLPRQKT